MDTPNLTKVTRRRLNPAHGSQQGQREGAARGSTPPRARNEKAPASHQSEGEPSALLVDLAVASGQPMVHAPRLLLYASVREQTKPPVPPFIHCDHELAQPPLETPAQLRPAGCAASHVPDAGRPNSWVTGAGAEPTPEEELPPPPPITTLAWDVVTLVPLESPRL